MARNITKFDPCKPFLVGAKNKPPQEALLTLRMPFTSDSLVQPFVNTLASIQEIEPLVVNILQEKDIIGNVLWEVLEALSPSRVAPL